MTDANYKEHIQYTHNAYCRIVIRHASIDAAVCCLQSRNGKSPLNIYPKKSLCRSDIDNIILITRGITKYATHKLKEQNIIETIRSEGGR